MSLSHNISYTVSCYEPELQAASSSIIKRIIDLEVKLTSNL